MATLHCVAVQIDAHGKPQGEEKKGSARTVTPTGREALHLGLMLSHEHTGFTFVPDLLIASGLVKVKRGGEERSDEQGGRLRAYRGVRPRAENM